jgi:hypothetical protein
MVDHDSPIACTLDGASFSTRLAEIRALFAKSLKGSQRNGLRLHLTFDVSARADVEAMVRKEQTCCAFLDFQLGESDNALELTITVPSRAADTADDLLSPFTPTTGAGTCGCLAKPPSKWSGALAWLSLGGGGVALVCGAACALAVVLAGLGVGTVWLSNLDAIQTWWPLTTGMGLLVLTVAWFVRYRIGGTHAQLRALQLASALVLLGAAWGMIEAA